MAIIDDLNKDIENLFQDYYFDVIKTRQELLLQILLKVTAVFKEVEKEKAGD